MEMLRTQNKQNSLKRKNRVGGIKFPNFKNYYYYYYKKEKKKKTKESFPGGSVVKKPPASAGPPGLIPGLERSHLPQSKKDHTPQLLSLHSRARDPHC